MLWEACIDVIELIGDTVPMRRFRPFLLIAAFLVLLVGGTIWKFISAKECADNGDIVHGPMTRGLVCVAP